jgi:MoaA/NifB/PqqE/SkfB family radical SAM enzyme
MMVIDPVLLHMMAIDRLINRADTFCKRNNRGPDDKEPSVQAMMMMSIFKKFFHPPLQKRFSVWQIELTTRCSLQCTMCVKEADPDYLRKDMDMEDFRRILPHLKEVESIVLEGWGESLLHPSLIDCIGMAKKEGTRVGFVTCGMGITEGLASGIVDAGCDFIGFSLSGATADTHNSIRLNSDFETIIRAIGLFQPSDAAKGRTRLKRHIVYLMLQENIGELPLLIELAHKLDIADVVLVNLIQVSSEWQDRAKVFACEGRNPYEAVIREAEQLARRLKINLTRPNLSPHDTAVCSENPLSNLYISVEGEVSPCVYLYPPVTPPFRRIFCGREERLHKVSFGNIFRDPFAAIWSGASYVAFRERFLRREKAAEEAYQAFLEHRRHENDELPQPPGPCRTCHKMLGL